MIYFCPTADGHFVMVTDREDRQAGAAADLIDNMEPGSHLGMMLDTAQICARKAGLLESTNEPVPGKEHLNCTRVIFPFGPFCVPRPATESSIEEEAERTRQLWQRARVVRSAEGYDCTPVPRARRIAR